MTPEVRESIEELTEEMLEQFLQRPVPFSIFIHPTSPDGKLEYLGNIPVSDALDSIESSREDLG